MSILETIQERFKPINYRESGLRRKLIPGINYGLFLLRLDEMNIVEAERQRLENAVVQPQVTGHWRL